MGGTHRRRRLNAALSHCFLAMGLDQVRDIRTDHRRSCQTRNAGTGPRWNLDHDVARHCWLAPSDLVPAVGGSLRGRADRRLDRLIRRCDRVAGNLPLLQAKNRIIEHSSGCSGSRLGWVTSDYQSATPFSELDNTRGRTRATHSSEECLVRLTWHIVDAARPEAEQGAPWHTTNWSLSALQIRGQF